MVTKKTKNRNERIVSPAIKPGSFQDYLLNHPEEMNRILREYGIDPDDYSTLEDWDIAKAKNNKKQKTTRD